MRAVDKGKIGRLRFKIFEKRVNPWLTCFNQSAFSSSSPASSRLKLYKPPTNCHRITHTSHSLSLSLSLSVSLFEFVVEMAAVEDPIVPMEGVEEEAPVTVTEAPEETAPAAEDPAPKKGKEVKEAKPKKPAAPRKPRSAPAHPSYSEVFIISFLYVYVCVYVCACVCVCEFVFELVEFVEFRSDLCVL